MSDTVTRQRPSMDLDDFERRLQAQSRHHHEDDPLAELARIVGEQPDPYDDVFAQPQAAPAGFRPSFEPHRRQEPSLGAPPPRFSADFAAIEAGLRGGPTAPQPMQALQPLHEPSPQAYLEPTHDPYADDPGYVPESYPHDPRADAWIDPGQAPARAGTRRPVYVMAASIAIAVVGIGVAFAYKGSGSSPREIKTIMAAAGPTKIQPPAEPATDQADQDAAALGQQPAPTKLVSREEQPVDLSQAVQDNAARDASRGTDAASVPVPLSPGQASGNVYPDYAALGGNAKPGDAPADSASPAAASPAAASPTYGDQGFGVGMPRPKRVKSVSVRPDGTIVNEDAPAPAANDTTAGDAPVAKAAAATPAAPAPKVSNRASPRVAAAERPADGAGAADDGDAAPPARPAKAVKAKPVRVATAEAGTSDATAETAETKPVGAGGFAVQLAAPASEADARSATSRFLKKYSGALHGHRLGFHRAESNGHTVYRVRVSSLTREDAASLCGKLKSEGGTCFVARD